jgi:hypothetical protein
MSINDLQFKLSIAPSPQSSPIKGEEDIENNRVIANKVKHTQTGRFTYRNDNDGIRETG